MRIIKTSDGLPSDTLGQLAWYNGYDCMTLMEIREGLLAEMREDHLRVYTFEMDLQSALLQMAFAGIPVDTHKRDELIRTTQAEKARLESIIHSLCEAISYYEYYRDVNTLRFATASGTPAASLPRTWNEWTNASLSDRRDWKAAAGPDATTQFQKALKDLSEPFNPNSSTQKLRLFYHFFGTDTNKSDYPDFPPPWGRTKGLREVLTRSSNNEYTPGVDRDSLERLAARAGDDPSEAAYWALPFINVCLAHADAAKTLQFLNCKLDQGVFYSSFGAVTETGRLSSKKSAFGNRGWNCFEPGAEALTPMGWKLLEEIQSGDLVMQWWPNGNMNWGEAEPIESYYEGNLHCLVGEQIGMSVTHNHRLALEGHHSGPAFYEATAQELFARKSPTRLKIGGSFIGGTWNAPRLIAAYLADGSLENASSCYWRFNFKKDRKIKRIRVLLEEADISWREHEASHPDIKLRFGFNIPDYWPVDWGPWIFDLTLDSANALLDELAFWDGTQRGESFRFFMVRKYRAEWVQTLAHICGRGATFTEREQNSASWFDILMYTVNVKPRGWARVGAEHKQLRYYAGPTYCLSVPSSYFLVRQHEKVAVTGNSQNVTPPLRVIFTAPQGHKLSAIDYGQIESRMVAARCFVQFGATAYWNAVHSGDLHSLAASMVWPELPWPQDFTIDYLEKHGPFPRDLLKAAKKLASEPFYRGKSRRDVSKTLGHGTSYCGKPPQMSKHSHIDVKLIEHYQAVFFSVFPEVRWWHQWVAEQVMVHQKITTLLGRTRQFFGRPSDDATIREAVAYEPQSLAADYTNTALLAMHKAALYGELPIVLRLQKHDEAGFTYSESDEDLVIPQVVQIMEWPVQLVSPSGETRTLVIPTDVEVGWNLGRRSDSNPDGLTGWPDTRVRQRDPFSLDFLRKSA